MKISAITALFVSFSTAATAAPMTVGMRFLDPAGVEVGTGSFTYDPSVTINLYFDGTTFCSPTPADPACAFAATWTPLSSFQWSVYGITFGAPQLFLEGFTQDDGRGATPGLYPGGWFFGDVFNGEGLDIAFPILSAPGTWALGSYQLFDLDPVRFANASAGGSILFTPTEIPLPPAALLFLGGLAAIATRRQKGRPRIPDRFPAHA